MNVTKEESKERGNVEKDISNTNLGIVLLISGLGLL